jgi:Family of unknown function (DUF5678)
MTTITIAQHWVDELTELQPDSSATNIANMVDAALQQYIFRQRQEKIARERRWYELHHAELLQQYAGQHIAIHNSRVIDADLDGRRLSKRIRQQHGRIAMAIIQVADSPEPPTFYMRSPKLAPV